MWPLHQWTSVYAFGDLCISLQLAAWSTYLDYLITLLPQSDYCLINPHKPHTHQNVCGCWCVCSSGACGNWLIVMLYIPASLCWTRGWTHCSTELVLEGHQCPRGIRSRWYHCQKTRVQSSFLIYILGWALMIYNRESEIAFILQSLSSLSTGHQAKVLTNICTFLSGKIAKLLKKP